MRIFIRLMFMFLAFSIEVKVHAISLDKDCDKDSYCYFFTENTKISKLGMTELRFQPGTAMKKASENNIEIVVGKILVDSKSHVKIKTLFGEVLLQAGRAIVEIDKNNARVISLSTGVFYRGRGQEKPTYLKPTLIVEMGRVGSNGLSKVQFPESTSKNILIKKWAAYYKQSERNQFMKLAKSLTAFTYLGPHELAFTYQETAKREQASLDQRRAEERERRAKYMEETEYLRNLFRKKNHLDYSSY